jgi:hypothetical protein
VQGPILLGYFECYSVCESSYFVELGVTEFNLFSAEGEFILFRKIEDLSIILVCF